MRIAIRLAILCLSFTALQLRAADCPTAADYPAAGITLIADASGPPSFALKNPIKGGSVPVICLLTEEDLLAGHTCATANPVSDPQPVLIGVCAGGKSNFFLTPAAITGADAFLIRFDKNTPGITTRYLRVEGKDAASKDLVPPPMYKITAIAGVQDFAKDSRYKLWIYTGYTYLRTKSDFKDGYAELLARYETRLYDQGVYMKRYDPAMYKKITEQKCEAADKCGKFPNFRVLRLYGETGLTGTAVVDPNNTAAPTRVRQAFAGSAGIGAGWTLPVAVENPGDTNAFSILGVVRLGVLTIPGIDANPNATPPVTVATPGKIAYNWMAAVRIENERGGNFEGKYFEIGLGQSEQFTRKKVPRLRADLMVPFPSENDLYRFATRMQFDTATPFNKKTNVEPGGEIRLSLVFNIDMQELAKRLSGK